MHSDYSPASKIILSYPERFYNEHDSLVPFYDELISLIPNDFQIWIISNNNQTIQKLKDKFSYKRIDFLGIKGWDEIWLRDCIGQIKEKSIIKTQYYPRYCNSSAAEKYYQKINQLSKIVCKEILGKEIIHVPLIMDGGNFVNNDKFAIITEKIFTDNAIRTKSEIRNIIYLNTGLEPIFIEKNKCDSIGHSDAYISFLNKDTVVVPSYPSFPFLKDDIDFVNHFTEKLKVLDLNIVTIYDRPVDEVGICGCRSNNLKPCLYSARGNYINFLRINNLIILPEYNLPTKKETDYYNRINGSILEERGFEVKRINCDSLSKLGGVLRCISYLA